MSNFELLKPAYVGATADSVIRLFLPFLSFFDILWVEDENNRPLLVLSMNATDGGIHHYTNPLFRSCFIKNAPRFALLCFALLGVG